MRENKAPRCLGTHILGEGRARRRCYKTPRTMLVPAINEKSRPRVHTIRVRTQPPFRTLQYSHLALSSLPFSILFLQTSSRLSGSIILRRASRLAGCFCRGSSRPFGGTRSPHRNFFPAGGVRSLAAVRLPFFFADVGRDQHITSHSVMLNRTGVEQFFLLFVLSTIVRRFPASEWEFRSCASLIDKGTVVFLVCVLRRANFKHAITQINF